MIINQNHRLYSFVNSNYLSPLQHGLQTGHVIGELAAQTYTKSRSARHANRLELYKTWALKDKVIIICKAYNSAGVLGTFDQIQELTRKSALLNLPSAMFREDAQSLGGAPTACGVVVPERLWNVSLDKTVQGEDLWIHNTSGEVYDSTTEVWQFLNLIKKAPLV